MQRALTLLAAVTAGLAAWTSLGSVAVLATDPMSSASAAVRVGLLPGLGLALGFIVVFGGAFVRRPRARAAVGVLALLLLPWLPIDLPAAALLWSGPVVGAVWMAWLIATAALVGARLPTRVAPWIVEPRRAMATAFLVAAAAYVSGLALASDVVPGGDEPHYLIIARSLIADGDLRIDDNHAARDYLPWFEGELKPDYLRRGIDGAIYSIHAPGLPALIAPALALFGYRGAMVFLALVSALGMSLVWRLAWDVTRGVAAAWFAWAAVAFAAPFFLHAFTVYPDAPAGVLLVIGLLALVRLESIAEGGGAFGRRRRAWLVGAGVALAALPWLHTRYALLAGAAGAAMLGRLAWRRRWLDAAVFLAVPALSAIGWFWFFQAIYGTPNPAAPYGGYTQSSAAFIPTGLTGLLVDQQFGLLTTAPVLVFAFIGIAVMLVTRDAERAAERRLLALALLGICVPYALATSAYRMWWGGFSGPARFLTPLVPALAIPLAVLWARARTEATRALAVWALVWSIGLTWVLVVESSRHIAFSYSSRTPVAAWAAWVSNAADVASGLPALFRGSLAVAIQQASVWMGALAIGWLALRFLERRSQGPVRLTAVWAPLILALAAMAALTIAWRVEEAAPLRPLWSQAALAVRFTAMTPGPRTGVAFTPGPGPFMAMRTSRPRDVLPRLRFSNEPRRHTGEGDVLFHLPVLPAGDYRLRLAPRFAAETLRLLVAPVTTKSPEFATVAADERVRLPVPVRGLVLMGTTPFQAGEVSLEPVSLYESPFGRGVRAIRAARYGESTVFFTDDDAFPEATGFWVKAAAETTFAVGQTGSGTPFRLQLRNAPVGNRVTVSSGGWRESFDLAAGDVRQVTLPGPGAAGRAVRNESPAIVVRIRAERGIRPADVDPGNRDLRRLGVWVSID